jgi:hypothetical protein
MLGKGESTKGPNGKRAKWEYRGKMAKGELGKGEVGKGESTKGSNEKRAKWEYQGKMANGRNGKRAKREKGEVGKGEMAKIGGEMAKGEVGKGEMGINHDLQPLVSRLLSRSFT